MTPAASNQVLFCKHALLPDGWAENVRMQINADGFLQSVQRDAASKPNDQSINGPVIPGMGNAHSHAFQYALVGLTHHRGQRSDSFWTWREAMYGLVAQLDQQRLQRITRMAYRDMLCAGYTHVCEFHYLHHLPPAENSSYCGNAADTAALIATAGQAVGLGLTLLPVLYQHAGFGQASPQPHQQPFVMATEAYLELVAHLQNALSAQPNQNVGYAPHSLRAVGLEALQQVSRAAADGDAILHLHLAEQVDEVKACVAEHRARPYELLHQYDLPASHWNLVHATHLDADERAQAVDDGAGLVICPSTEADLGDGYFPMDTWMAAGGSWAVGSDSNSLINPAAELRMLEYQQRLSHQQRNVLGDSKHSTGSRLWLEAAKGGGQAAGLALGEIAEGYRADLLELNASHPRLAGLAASDMLDAWLFSGACGGLKRAWVSGCERVRDGKLVDAEQHRLIESEFVQTMAGLAEGLRGG